jgi:hypothetical protein
MEIETIYQLKCDDLLVYQGESIKVSLRNGEILIGTYEYSDCCELEIEREGNEIRIELEDIRSIEVVR